MELKEITDNYILLHSLIDKYITTPEMNEKYHAFYSELQDILYTAPNSSKISGKGCYPGGYLEHTIDVIRTALTLRGTYKKLGHLSAFDSYIFIAALHSNLGRLIHPGLSGYLPYYIDNPNDWQIKNQGMQYTINPEIPYMRPSDRTLFILQQRGFYLSHDVYMALLLYNGLYDTRNEVYMKISDSERKPSKLVYIIQQANEIAANR